MTDRAHFMSTTSSVRQIPWAPGFPSECILIGVRLHHVLHYPRVNNEDAPSHLYVAIPWQAALVDDMNQLKQFTLQHITQYMAEIPNAEDYMFTDIFGREVSSGATLIDRWGNLPPQLGRSYLPEPALEYLTDTKLEFVGAHHMTPVILQKIVQGEPPNRHPEDNDGHLDGQEPLQSPDPQPSSDSSPISSASWADSGSWLPQSHGAFSSTISVR